MPSEPTAAVTLPVTMVTLGELEGLQSELSAISDFFAQAARRQPGTSVVPPAASLSLEYLAKQYACNLLDNGGRQKMADILQQMHHLAKPIHITFADQPPKLWLQRLSSWFRENIDQNILLKVSYAPHVVSGCVVRVGMNTYDFSVGAKLDKARPVLLHGILSQRYRPAEPAPK